MKTRQVSTKPSKTVIITGANSGLGYYCAEAIAMTAAAALISLVVPTHAPAQADPDTACTAGKNLQFICGLPGPEDLVQVPGTGWIIASSFAGLNTPKTFNGGLGLIDPARRTVTKIVLNSADVARAPYTACSTPPNPARFSAHGLNIRREANGTSTLFVIGHGDREVIEVFDVAVTAGSPALTWIGCVPATQGAFNNSVVGLPDGRILVTDFLHGSTTLADLFANRKTGAVYQWTPGGAFEKLPGTELSGPNGIEVTADLRHMFVADSGSAAVLRYDLKATKKPPLTINPGFRTDNLRWSSDGQLLLAGTKADPTCKPDDQKCPETLFVKALDPNTRALTTLLEIPATPTFSNLSSALVVDGILWLGSPDGDRVAYMKLRKATGRKSTVSQRLRATGDAQHDNLDRDGRMMAPSGIIEGDLGGRCPASPPLSTSCHKQVPPVQQHVEQQLRSFQWKRIFFETDRPTPLIVRRRRPCGWLGRCG